MSLCPFILALDIMCQIDEIQIFMVLGLLLHGFAPGDVFLDMMLKIPSEEEVSVFGKKMFVKMVDV